MKYVLSVDIGTTSLKAGVISADGEVVFVSKYRFSKANRYVAASFLDGLKYVVSEFHNWVKEGCSGKNSVFISEEIKLSGIAVSGNGPTVVCEDGLTLGWNENPEDIQARLWSTAEGAPRRGLGPKPQDSRSVSGSEVRNSRPLQGVATKSHSLFLPRILALRSLFPESFEKSRWIFSGPEYLIYKLTGRPVTILPEERFKSAYWGDEELKEEGIAPEKMPEFVSTGSECGFLLPELMAELDFEKELPVFAGGPDFVVALIGTNTLQKGKLCDRCGSSEGFNFCVDRQLFHKDLRTLPSVISGLWNVSALIPESGKLGEEELLQAEEAALNLLRGFSKENGIEFPEKLMATGGQLRNKRLLNKKVRRLGIKIGYNPFVQAELFGDACAAFVGLGVYKNLEEAAGVLVCDSSDKALK